VLPGPDPNHLWAPINDSSGMQLAGFDGTLTGTRIALPDNIGLVTSDGAGYLLFASTGGVYDARPDGAHRVTTGVLLAAGPTRWLTVECDDEARCATTVISRSTGTRRELATPPDAYQGNEGVISPDGSTAAMLQPDYANGRTVLHLLNLNTGLDRATSVLVLQDQSPNSSAIAWSPDSRSLFVIDATGAPVVVDPTSGRATRLGVVVPPLIQLTFRGSSLG
jgi:hypothetical protein